MLRSVSLFVKKVESTDIEWYSFVVVKTDGVLYINTCIVFYYLPKTSIFVLF